MPPPKPTLDITQRQLQDGYSNTLGLLNARTGLSAGGNRSAAGARPPAIADTAALFQALGGGWWHRTDLLDEEAKNGEIKRILSCGAGALLLIAGCGKIRQCPATARQQCHPDRRRSARNIKLYTVAAGQFPQEVDTTGMVDFDNNQATAGAGAVLRHGVAASWWSRAR